MPVSDVGRKGRRVDKAIPLLLQPRDSRRWHTFDVHNVIAYLDAIGFIPSYYSSPLTVRWS